MTVPQQPLSPIDIVELLPAQRETVFVPVMKQPNLPHQMDLRFVLCKTAVQPFCACGLWGGMAYSPVDHSTKFPRALQQYREHLADATSG